MWFNEFSTIDLTQCSATKTKKKTVLQNKAEFWVWFSYLKEMGINRYKLTGDFPETLDERTILQSLFWYGSFTIFNDSGVWLSLPGLPASDLTVYGYPRKVNVYGRNGYNKQVGLFQYNGDEKAVNAGVSGVEVYDKKGWWIQEKKNPFPLANMAIITADRLADTMRSIDVMRNKMKDPFVVLSKEETLRSVQDFFKDLKMNDELIVTTGVFDVNSVDIKKLDFNPELVKSARSLFEWYLSQYLSFCGLNSNPASDKDERLVVGEVEANDEETESNINPAVDYMNKQLETVNDLTGWTMKMEVTYNDGKNKDLRGDFGDVFNGGDISSDSDGE